MKFTDLLTQRAGLVSKLADDDAAIAAAGDKITQAQAERSAAESQKSTDSGALTSVDKAIGRAVAAKPYFVPNPDGSMTIYQAAGDGGYVPFTALPADTDL